MVNKLLDFCKKAVNVGLITTMLSVPILANHKDDAAKAYKSGDYVKAVQEFKEGQKLGEVPKTAQWNNFISNLESKTIAAPKDNRDAFSWALLGTNILSLGGATYFGIMSKIEADKYNKMYDDMDNTNLVNLKLLRDQNSKIEGNHMWLAGFGSLAALLTYYNLFDKNGFFNKNNVSAQVYDPKINGPSIAFNKEF
jgi:hypothetical protein